MNSTYIILFLYIILILGISFKNKHKAKSLNNFTLGNRKANGWMSAFSYGSAYFSAVMFIGYSGSLGWKYGILAVIIGICNALIGTLLAWIVLAKRTRKETRELDAKTLPQYLEKKYNSKFLKYLAASIIFIFLLPYSSSVYMGLTSVCSVLLNMDISLAMTLIAVLTTIIVLSGGYKTTLKADFIQGILILIGVIILVIGLTNSSSFPGFNELIIKTKELNLDTPSIISLISIILITSFGPWGLPQMINKFYAIKDENEIKKGMLVSTVFSLIVAGIGFFVGSISITMYNNLSQIPAPGAGNTDYLVPNIILNSNISELFYGFILVLLLAASVSTLASITLTASSSISMDLIDDFRKQQSKNSFGTKLICIIFILLSYIIASNDIPILVMMSYSWGILSGTFIAIYLLSLYWKKINKTGIIVGMITGFIISSIPLICKILSINITLGDMGLLSDNGNLIACFAIILSFIATYIATKLDKNDVK